MLAMLLAAAPWKPEFWLEKAGASAAWVIAAIILWAIAMALGRQTGEGYRATAEMAAQLVSSGSPRSPELAAAMGTSRAFWTHWLSVIVIVLILVDMIWKPGA